MKNCVRCGKEFEPNKFTPYQIFCSSSCKDMFSQCKRRKELRPVVIQLLGGKCVACGIDDEFVLAIDHINDDGKDDRIFKKEKLRFYRWAIKHPEELKLRYQVLCHNHNQLKEYQRKEFKRRFPHISVKEWR